MLVTEKHQGIRVSNPAKLAHKIGMVMLFALFCAFAAQGAWADGAVYAMTNALGHNAVVVYHRAADGTLTQVQVAATGGGGSGLQLGGIDSLGSQGSVQLDQEHDLLFVVNTETLAENNGAGAYNTDCSQGTITSFRVAKDGTLTFADRVFSGGLFPNSLTVRAAREDKGRGDDDRGNGQQVLYVLNAGGPETALCNLVPSTANGPNVTGFKVDRAGHMVPLDSTQSIDPGPASGSGENCAAATASGFSGLTGAPVGDFDCGLNPPSFPRSPAEVRFTRDGDQLVVTVKGTNTIYVFPVDEHGRAGSPTATQESLPALPGYFGFTFDKRDHMLVTELFGSATSNPQLSAGAVSSFSVGRWGNLSPISSHVNDGGTAACWITLEPRTERYAYVSNNLSASISSYSVSGNGSVTLLDGKAGAGSGPNDLATATERGASYLYVLNAGAGTVGAFQINLANGSLTAISGGSGLPAAAAQGLAAF